MEGPQPVGSGGGQRDALLLWADRNHEKQRPQLQVGLGFKVQGLGSRVGDELFVIRVSGFGFRI